MAQQFVNFLLNNDFRFNIRKLPKTNFHVTNVSLPEMSMGDTQQPTPFNTVYHSGDELYFGQLVTTFIVDDNMDNYKEIYSWMMALSSAKNFQGFKDLRTLERSRFWKDEVSSDAALIINSSYSNPKITMNFKNCRPSALSLIVPFTAEDMDAVVMKASVSFKFDYYDFS